MKVAIFPSINPDKDTGEGGIYQVIKAQYRWLPEHGVELVSDINQADVINVHADDPKFYDLPCAASSHGLYWAGYEWPNWCHDANRKLVGIMKRADSTSVPSKFVHNAFARGMLLDPFILHHGIEFDEWEPQENHGYIFWGKTRVDPICDPEPMNRLARMVPKIKFVSTFGNDVLSNLTLTGKVNHERSKALIQHAAVYLATVMETGGITVLEAAAAGVPALGFNWGVNPEIIIHGETGYLVDPGDYEGLREGLAYCLQHRDRLGANAREYVKQSFQWKDRIKNYIPFFQSAIDHFNLNDKLHNPTVSVVVTAYNLEKYLPACIESVLSQDYKDFELIIVDDASPDKCGEIADRYAQQDSRIKVIHNYQNVYLAEARNIGFRAASGKYLLPLDADDEIGPGALRILAESLDQDRNKDIVGGGFELIEPDGRRWVSDWPPKAPSFNHQIKMRNQVMYSSMYRRWVWERTGGYRRRWKSAEDAEFWTRAMSYGAEPAKVTEQPTLVYNNRPSSMSHSIPTPAWTSWFIWASLSEFTPFGASGEPPNGRARPVLAYDPPLTTVLIPVGPGHEYFLQDCLDSIVNQTMQNWRVIVVNDTGRRWFDDNVTNPKHLTPYTQGYPFVYWIDSDMNRGVAAARNSGISYVQTESFVLLDADDYLQPFALDLMYKSWKAYGGWCYTDWYDELGQYKQAQDFDFKTALGKMPGPSTGIYTTEEVRAVDGFDQNLSGWEDWDLLLSLMENGICGTRIKYPAFTYRYDRGNRREENHSRKDEILEEIHSKHELLYRGEC